MLVGGRMMARYENGIIVHHTALGAFEVHGLILDEYRRRDEAVLGYPISDKRLWMPGNVG